MVRFAGVVPLEGSFLEWSSETRELLVPRFRIRAVVERKSVRETPDDLLGLHAAYVAHD